MRTAFDFVIVFYLLCTLNGCFSTPACDYSSNKQVFGACQAKYVGTFAAGSTFYIDTGTGPNEQENLCMCTLKIHTFTGLGINFAFQADESIKQLNHYIQVDSHVLNSTVTKLDIRIQVETDIFIKTDGIGGVCVSVTANKSGTFGLNCNSTQITTLTTAIGSNSPTSNKSQNTTSGTTELSFNTTPYSQTYSSGDNKERLIGPVVGGVSGFVVLVAVTAIVIFFLRRRKRKLPKENSIHLDKASNDQAHGEYIDMMGNPLSVSSVADDRAISFIDCTYDDVKLDSNAENQKDKKKAAIKLNRTENNYRYTSEKDNKTECLVSSDETIESSENFAVYTAINKPQKIQAHTNQNEENSAIYSAVNKPLKIQAYTSQESVYDRTDNSDDTVRKMEDYHRLGAVKAIGNATEDTYESAAIIGRNEHFNQDDYDTAHVS